MQLNSQGYSRRLRPSTHSRAYLGSQRQIANTLRFLTRSKEIRLGIGRIRAIVDLVPECGPRSPAAQLHSGRLHVGSLVQRNEGRLGVHVNGVGGGGDAAWEIKVLRRGWQHRKAHETSDDIRR